jgi:hypothetical protein
VYVLCHCAQHKYNTRHKRGFCEIDGLVLARVRVRAVVARSFKDSKLKRHATDVPAHTTPPRSGFMRTACMGTRFFPHQWLLCQ